MTSVDVTAVWLLVDHAMVPVSFVFRRRTTHSGKRIHYALLPLEEPAVPARPHPGLSLRNRYPRRAR